MRINIKAFPGSSREELVKDGDILKAYVKAAPDKGKANKALVALLAREYGVKKSAVTIVRGQTSRVKVVEIAVGAGVLRP